MTSTDDEEDWQDPPRTVAEIVEELLEGVPWELQDNRYPVQVTTSETRIVWIEAPSHAEAVASLNDNGEWYEHLANAEPFAHDFTIEMPDEWHYDGQIYSDATLHGPVQQCQLCKEPPSWRPGHISHALYCPVQVARESAMLAHSRISTSMYDALKAARDALKA